jgi:Sulfotransferase family
MIFVTGCPRSGTSLTAKILMGHGCNLGEVNSLYENLNIREQILKPYLRRIGCDPLGQRKLPTTHSLLPLPHLAKKVLTYLPGSEPRAYKDAKLTLVYPIFAAAFPDASWIICRRDPDRIVDSCLRTAFMFSYRERQPWYDWVMEHEFRFAEMRQKLRVIEVWPDQYIKWPLAFEQVTKFCGLEFNESVVDEAIDRTAWSVAPDLCPTQQVH